MYVIGSVHYKVQIFQKWGHTVTCLGETNKQNDEKVVVYQCKFLFYMKE